MLARMAAYNPKPDLGELVVYHCIARESAEFKLETTSTSTVFFGWFVILLDTRLAFGWLVKRNPDLAPLEDS